MRISKRGWAMGSITLCLAMMACTMTLRAQSISDAIQNEELLKYQAAKNIYAQILAKEPSNAEVYYHLGIIAYHSFQYDSANYFFAKGKQINGNEPLNFVGCGLMNLHDKDNATARQNFDKALGMAAGMGKDKNAYTEQQIADAVWLEQDQKDADYAFDLANKAVKADDKNLRYKITLGDAYLVQGKGREGISVYESVQDANPKYLLAQLKVANCYASPSAGNYQAAQDIYNKIVAEDPSYPPVYPQLGETYYQTNDIPKAKDCYQKFLLLVGNSPAERLRYAEFLYFIKDYKSALVQLDLAYQGLPDNVVLLRLKAYCEAETGDAKTGLRSIQRMFAKAKPEQVQGIDYEYYGRLLVRNKQDSLGIINLNKAYKDDSSKVYLLDTVSASYAAQKKYGLAAATMEQKLRRTKDNINPQDYYNLARYYLLQGNYIKADTNFAMVVKNYPDWPVGYYYRALCNSNIDSTMKTGAAKPYYEKFLQVSAKDSASYKSQILEADLYMVSYYYNKNDYEKAKEYALKVRAIDPANTQNNEVLKYIERKKKK